MSQRQFIAIRILSAPIFSVPIVSPIENVIVPNTRIAPRMVNPGLSVLEAVWFGLS